MREKLPPLPNGIGHLSDEEWDRLLSRFKNLPKTMDDCVTCKGRKTFRWYSQADPNKIVEYDCDCRSQYLLHRYFLAHGIPKRYQVLSWRDLRTDVDGDALAKIVSYVEHRESYFDNGRGLYLYGDHGTGKTMMGSLVLKRFLADGRDGFFSTFHDVLRHYDRGIKDAEDYRWFETHILNAEVLMIDDPGKENMTHSGKQVDFVTRLMDLIIRTRSDNLTPTIITSNHTLDEFEERYKKGAVSLLTESSVKINVKGTDARPAIEERADREAELGLVRPVVVG